MLIAAIILGAFGLVFLFLGIIFASIKLKKGLDGSVEGVITGHCLNAYNYNRGKPVTVHYNPANPEESSLSRTSALNVVGIVFIPVGCLVLLLAMIFFFVGL